MKKSSLLLAATVIVTNIFANAEKSENLVINGNAANGLNNWENIQQVVDGGQGGAKCFEITGSTQINSLALIPVDAQSEYKLTGWFKSGNDKPNNLYFGLLLFDKSKRPIISSSVNALAKSETVVVENVKEGETIVKIQDASTWQLLFQKKRLMIAFDVDASGAYSDLPNYRLYNVTHLEEKDGIWQATIAKPLVADYSAGSKVRAHEASSSYMYAYIKKRIFTDWTECGSTIKSMVKSGMPTSTFWPGTKYVKILILANCEQKDGETLQFGSIRLEKVESKK